MPGLIKLCGSLIDLIGGNMIKLNSANSFFINEETLRAHTTVAIEKQNRNSYKYEKNDIPEDAIITKETTEKTYEYKFGPCINLHINGKHHRLDYTGSEAWQKRDADFKKISKILETHDKGSAMS